MIDMEELKTTENATGVSRPSSLADFNGQSAAKENLATFLESARMRSSHLAHTLLFGPPGLGKTTLAAIIANELGVGFTQIGAPAIEKPADLVALLGVADDHDVVFIDEIHALPRKIMEMLYVAMEDFVIDLIVGEGAEARKLALPLPKFTLIGATTNPGLLTQPLRDRFGIKVALETYTDDEMRTVILRAAPQLGLVVDTDAAHEIGRRSRGTPRVGLHLLERIRDFAVTRGLDTVSHEGAVEFLGKLGVDARGLNDTDRKYLQLLRRTLTGKAMGVKTLASSLNETVTNLEENVEPYLLRLNLIEKTATGRRLVAEDPLAKYRKQGVLDL